MHRTYKSPKGRRLCFDLVKDFVERQCGWKLLSREYKNQNTALRLKCPKGHETELTFAVFRKKQLCPICAQEKRTGPSIVREPIPKIRGRKRFMGIDQSSKMTGISIFEGNKLLHYGLYIAPNRKDFMERNLSTCQHLISLVNMWQVDKVAFEDVPLVVNRNSGGYNAGLKTYSVLSQTLGYLRGTMQTVVGADNVFVVNNNTWKHHSKIKGSRRKEIKDNVRNLCSRLYGINVGEDEADAVLIGRWLAENHGVETGAYTHHFI